MTTYNYYIGLQDKDTRQVLYTKDAAMLMLVTMLKEKHRGLTLTDVKGGYSYDNGSQAYEPTIKVTLFDDALSHAELDDIKNMFNQESIAIEEVESKILFI